MYFKDKFFYEHLGMYHTASCVLLSTVHNYNAFKYVLIMREGNSYLLSTNLSVGISSNLQPIEYPTK